MKNLEILNESTREKVDKLPFFIRYIIDKLVMCIDDLINGKCDEEVIVNTMSTLENNAKGRYCREDLVSFEKAADLLCFGKNRVALKRLLDKNGIRQVIINNHKVGYVRSEIMVLRDKLNEEIRCREVKFRKRPQWAVRKNL